MRSDRFYECVSALGADYEQVISNYVKELANVCAGKVEPMFHISHVYRVEQWLSEIRGLMAIATGYFGIQLIGRWTQTVAAAAQDKDLRQMLTAWEFEMVKGTTLMAVQSFEHAATFFICNAKAMSCVNGAKLSEHVRTGITKHISGDLGLTGMEVSWNVLRIMYAMVGERESRSKCGAAKSGEPVKYVGADFI